MKLIAGLGNPGEKYQDNRHNLGFMVVDSFATGMGLSWLDNLDWMGFYIKAEDFVLFKPSTFMNGSGEAISAVSNFYKIKNKEILIVYDDLDLEVGKIRLSFDGMAAGHHGIESIIKSLGTLDFGRLRIGIGHPNDDSGMKSESAENYVLADFREEEKTLIGETVKKAEEAINAYLSEGLEATMNRFN